MATLNITPSGTVTRTITKEIEHPLTGAKMDRKANISYPAVPESAAEIMAYFGGNEKLLAACIRLAVNAKFSSQYNAKLKGGKGFAAIDRVRKNLIIAGLSPDAALDLLKSNPELAKNLDVSDLDVAYTSGEVAAMFGEDNAGDTQEAAQGVETGAEDSE